MKKLTIEQKAQKYDKALKVAKDIRNGEATYIPDGTPVIEAIFPELKESEDELIRLEIVSAINIYCSEYHRGTKVRNDMLAWLEKQGKQKSVDGLTPQEAMDIAVAKFFEQGEQKPADVEEPNYFDDFRQTDSKVEPKFKVGDIVKHKKNPHLTYILKRFTDDGDYEFHAIGKDGTEGETCFAVVKYQDDWELIEQSLVDKVEPKFHEGEWLCENEPNNYARFIQILEIVNVQGKERYRISRDIHKDIHKDEDVVEFDFVEKYYHKFDIKDAKDGDMLVVGDEDGAGTAICGKNNKLSNNILYCYYDDENGFAINVPIALVCLLHPATKEQRDLLFQKMREAGYEWDAEKKELKKIENENYDGEDYGIDSLWHAQRILEKTLGKVDGYQSDDGILEHKCAISAVKQLSEQNLAWSEDDELRLNTICNLLEDLPQQQNWLKSLKDRVQPQPNQEWSEEDRKRIQRISDFIWKNRKGDTDDIYQQEQDVKWLKSLKNRVISQLPKEWSEEDKRIIDSIISTLSLSKSNYESNAVRETNFKSIKWLKSLRPQKALEAE